MGDKLHLLVTGASGFVGQALVRIALSKGHAVTVIVRDETQAPTGVRTLVHSLGSGAALRLPSDIDSIVHLAQSRRYRDFPGDADEMVRVNVMGAHELFFAAAASKISRFCLVSSGTVYEPFTGPLNEDATLAPISYLGVTKLAAEALAKPYRDLFPVSVLRLFAPYGPGQTARLVPDLIRRVREGVAVALPEVGGGMRFAPTFVDDVGAAILSALEGSWQGVYNVATPESLSIEDVAHRIADRLNTKPVFERKPGSAPIVVPELGKLTALYDMTRFRSFADGIAATLAGDA